MVGDVLVTLVGGIGLEIGKPRLRKDALGLLDQIGMGLRLLFVVFHGLDGVEQRMVNPLALITPAHLGEDVFVFALA